MSTSDKELLIHLENVTKVYGHGDNAVYAIKGVNLDLYKGEYVSIMGLSGSGKSTLFNMIGALDRCNEGSVEIGGVNLATLGDGELAYFRGQHIGYIFQAYNLIASMTALKNVSLPALFAGHSPEEAEANATEALERVGLADRMDHRPDQLSGGQQQRVAIARALVNKPTIVLGDEPTANLDLVTGEQIIDLLQELCRELQVTILTCTHDHKMLKASDRIVWIADGKVNRVEIAADVDIQVGGME